MSRPVSPSQSATTPHSPGAPTPLQTIARNLGHVLVNTMFPLRCGGCGELSAEVFCERCTAQLRPLRAPLCLLCGRPLDALAFTMPQCADCRTQPPDVDMTRAAFVFTAPLREAVHRLKYRRYHAYARRLAPLLARKWELDATLRLPMHAIVGVPLHSSRQRARGFNQSHLLAQELATLRGVPLFDGLVRKRKTPPQVGLDRAARRRNVKDAFEVQAKAQAQVAGKRFLLVDDVYTTGATLDECARVLKAAGAFEVFALTLGRQGTPNEPLVPELDWRTLAEW